MIFSEGKDDEASLEEAYLTMGVQDGTLDQKVLSVVRGLGFKPFSVDQSKLVSVVKDMSRSTANSAVPLSGRVRSYISQSGIIDDIGVFSSSVRSEYTKYGLMIIFSFSSVISKLRYIP